MSDLAASVRARLLNVAKARGADFNQVLVRFALERTSTVSASPNTDRFLPKGALLFTLWYDMPHHATPRVMPICWASAPVIWNPWPRPFAPSPASRWMMASCSPPTRSSPRKSARTPDMPARILISGELAKARCKT